MDPTYSVFYQEARVAAIARDLVMPWTVRVGVESGCCHHVRITKLMLSFRKALGLVEKLNDEATSEEPGATRVALSGTRLENAVVLGADEHKVLL